MSDTLADHLASFALSTRFEHLPEAVITEAKRRLLDAFACAADALGEPAPEIARKVAGTMRGEPDGALFGGERSPGRLRPSERKRFSGAGYRSGQ
jgi:2-methylcitrate dehydratase